MDCCNVLVLSAIGLLALSIIKDFICLLYVSCG